MKIAIGSDHAGYLYKEAIKEMLLKAGHEIIDFGTNSEDSVDYPIYIHPVAAAISAGEVERGIVLGKSGNGEAIVANRVKGVRCPVCWNEESAFLGRHHNNANCIAIGAGMVGQELALKMINIWLNEAFDGGRHQHRIELIDEMV
ncbi:MAG TPA: ribose 5-phosphate isomerase B [Fimbriimonadaceae bacterium]|jgi:ribose 5-phosphate isomerase B